MNQTWSRPAKFFILAVLIILLSFFLYYIRVLIRPLIVAALVAYLLHPLAAALDRGTHLNYRASVFLVYLVFLAVLVLIPAILTPVMIDQVASSDIEMQNVINGIDEFISQTSIFGYQIFQGIPGNLEESISQLLHPGQLFTSIQIITENVVWVFLVMILIYYFMADWEKLRMWVFDFIPASFHVDGIRLYRQLRVIWKTYLRGQLLTVFLVGLISGIAAGILGLPGAIVIGVVATVLAIIPSVGSSFMAFVTAVVAFFSDSATFKFSGFWFVVTVAIVFIGIHLFDNYYLRPRVLGHGLSLHPAVVLFAVIGALTLDGALLVLIIVPLISSIIVVLRYLFSRLTGADPWEKEIIEGFPEEKETVQMIGE